MEFLDSWPTWVVVLTVFAMRIVDVSMGTLRTIAVVNGRLRLSFVLALFEISVWLLAAAQVFTRVQQDPVLLLAFAGGYAVGNAVGVLIERRLALGNCVVRIISVERSAEIVERLRLLGQCVTTFGGQGRDGPRILIYITCARRDLERIVSTARALDPRLFYAVEPATLVRVLPTHTDSAWRALLRHKK